MDEGKDNHDGTAADSDNNRTNNSEHDDNDNTTIMMMATMVQSMDNWINQLID